MSELTGTYAAYAYNTTTNTLSNIAQTEVIHRAPAAGQIKIQVHATALNPVDVQLAGVDSVNKVILDWFGGGSSRKGEDGELASKIPGADVSGVVVAVGEGVVRWKVGDEVFGLWMSMDGNGTNQAYLTIPETAPIVPKPGNLSHIEAASLPLVFLTSYTGLVIRGGLNRDSEINVRQNAKVLVVGASGGTGIIGVQLAKSLGATVVAICSGKNADFVKEHGADEVIDYTSEDVSSAALSLGPYKVVYDCVGGTQLIPHLSALLAPIPTPSDPHHPPVTAGTYITIVGDKTSRTTMGGNITYLTTPSMLFRSIKGYAGLGPKYYCVNLTTGEEEMKALAEWSASGRVKPVIDGEPYSWTKLSEAYARLESGRSKGKVVVDWVKE
ncbi:Reticulon-4-interacting protein 1, mitochondrial OS=Bos taurus GN=RTN4IP1 PE=2 SV=1 [Rhizoctonia solani AG-1 IB]|uniref:Alcohol dehydrogenase n=1 Tax=Thanatephorus cucumeris (strain AG1-IB / isolate 7/3/14) TaxID=1108050 RepID=M5BMQ9_THACB|nr:alcohol dehydrogenase [Rhizoctonia solani AG-1 IB]CEL55352.1 Reticulon-4-interacting protein 1, mitochondrial OS=Bos taurus GN=RTN4IP1 PE=2 SV=1 [Rhizoctonia solani AG-1 IB]